MSRPGGHAYKFRNWPAYNDALKRPGSLTICFDPAMTWQAGTRGRQADDGDGAIQTCLTMKVLFGMALRPTTGFVESLLHLIDLDRAAPDFSMLRRCHRRTRGLCSRFTAHERETLEDHHRRRRRPQRGPAHITALWPNHLATMERLSPPKPHRNEGTLCETPESAPHGARLRPPGRGVPGSCGCPQRVHRARNTHHRWSQDRSIWGKGNSARHPICAAEPWIPLDASREYPETGTSGKPANMV